MWLCLGSAPSHLPSHSGLRAHACCLSHQPVDSTALHAPWPALLLALSNVCTVSAHRGSSVSISGVNGSTTTMLSIDTVYTVLSQKFSGPVDLHPTSMGHL